MDILCPFYRMCTCHRICIGPRPGLHPGTPGRWRSYRCHSDPHLILLESSLSIRAVQSSPGNSKVQPRVRPSTLGLRAQTDPGPRGIDMTWELMRDVPPQTCSIGGCALTSSSDDPRAHKAQGHAGWPGVPP